MHRKIKNQSKLKKHFKLQEQLYSIQERLFSIKANMANLKNKKSSSQWQFPEAPCGLKTKLLDRPEWVSSFPSFTLHLIIPSSLSFFFLSFFFRSLANTFPPGTVKAAAWIWTPTMWCEYLWKSRLCHRRHTVACVVFWRGGRLLRNVWLMLSLRAAPRCWHRSNFCQLMVQGGVGVCFSPFFSSPRIKTAIIGHQKGTPVAFWTTFHQALDAADSRGDRKYASLQTRGDLLRRRSRPSNFFLMCLSFPSLFFLFLTIFPFLYNYCANACLPQSHSACVFSKDL